MQHWKREDIGYTGISFPFRLTPSGTVATSTVNIAEGDLSHISEAVVQIIRTVRGERVMRRNWGANPVNIVFRPNTDVEMLYFASEIRDLLREYEPRVSLEECVLVDADPDQGSRVLRLNFKHRLTQVTQQITVTLE